MSSYAAHIAEKNPALLITLDLAVPMHMHEVRRWSAERMVAEARRCADEVAARGDVLQFGGSHEGEAATAFNALARGLAIAAYAPGGVDFAGRHWEAEQPMVADVEPLELELEFSDLERPVARPRSSRGRVRRWVDTLPVRDGLL